MEHHKRNKWESNAIILFTDQQPTKVKGEEGVDDEKKFFAD